MRWSLSVQMKETGYSQATPEAQLGEVQKTTAVSPAY
jgi:hypothetical protein